MRHEARNIIPLGNIIIGKDDNDKTGWRDPANWFMATVSNDGGVALTAIMTPPHNLAISAADNIINMDAIACLIDNIADYPIPGVLAVKEMAQCFANVYAAKHQKTIKIEMDQRVYELTEVNPNVQKIGELRLVDERDMSFFPFWLEAFAHEGFYGDDKMPLPMNEGLYQYHIHSKRCYVLEVDGLPVSLVGFSREMATVVGVGRVFTPPYFRGRGYASSAVAQLSQIALDKGFEKCVLYTNLDKPTPNSIYPKIGYVAICDSLMIKFV